MREISSKYAKAKINFIGMSTEEVTGSAHLISYKNKDVLLDYGFYQHNNKQKCYQVNNRNINKLKPTKLDSIIISHGNHLDHYGNLPMLYKNNCTAKIYVTPNTKRFWKILFEDNLKIVEKDAEYLSKITNKLIKPLYSKEDVDRMMNYVVEIDFGKEIQINEYMKFMFTPNYHIINSAQIELFIEDKNYKRKIYYTGDIGNISLKNKPFLTKLHKVSDADIIIAESTYCMNPKKINKEARKKDLEKIQTAIREACIEHKSNVIFASFAMERTQEILWDLYDIYGKNKDFNIPVILDSPLAVKLTNLFVEDGILRKDEQDKMKEILQWKNLKLVSDWKDSEMIQKDNQPKILCACSGFGESGRVRAYLQQNLGDEHARIVFTGYCGEYDTSLSGKIKNGKPNEVIDIDGVKVKNKATGVVLNSYSSHIQHFDMLDYYTSINGVKEIYLVHSNFDNRVKFAELLQEEYKKKCKTTKVYLGIKNMEVEI